MAVPWRAQVQSPRTHREPVAVVARQASPSPVVAQWSYSRSLPVGEDGGRRKHLPEAPVLRTQVKKEVDGVVQKLTKTGRVTIGIVALDTLRRWLSEEAQASFTVFHVEVCCIKCIQSTEKSLSTYCSRFRHMQSCPDGAYLEWCVCPSQKHGQPQDDNAIMICVVNS